MKAKLNYFSLVFLVLLSTAVTGILQAASYYVSTSGSDVTGTGSNGTPWATITYALTQVNSGDIINVAAGTYIEDIIVSLPVTISGAGAGSTFIVATDGNSTDLIFKTNGATVSGFTLTHNYTPAELSAWNFNNNGVDFNSGSGNTLTNCTVTLNRNGIYINNTPSNSSSNIISNNLITNNRTGINMTNILDYLQITGNTISNNWTEGLVTYANANVTNYSNVTVSGNIFDNNWYEEVTVKWAYSNNGTLDVTNNTFTDNPVTYSTSADTSLDEPSFTSQKPNVTGIGGTATEPANPLPTLRIYDSSPVMLTYNKFKTILVEPDQTIQPSINLANTGDIVYVFAGTYSGNLTISTGITLVSASGSSSTTISGTSGSPAIIISADGVTVNGFTITNNSGKTGVQTGNSNTTITNNIITNIGVSDATAGSDFGIVVQPLLLSIRNINISGNIISHIIGTAGSTKTAGGIFIGASGTFVNVTDLLVQNNVIDSVTTSPSAHGAYGILIDLGYLSTGQTDSAIISNNTISYLTGLWAHGIGLEGNTPNILIQGNFISYLTDYKSPTDAYAIDFQYNPSMNTANLQQNHFDNVSGGVYMDSASLANYPSEKVNAINNWWGSATGPTNPSNPGGIGAIAGTNILFSPWIGESYPIAAAFWPTNNIQVYSITPTLVWYLPTTPPPGSVITYDIMIRDSSNHSYSGTYPNYILLSANTGTSVAIPQAQELTGGHEYFYTIKTNFGGGVFTLSNEYSFSVNASINGAPQPVADWPVLNTDVFSSTPTLIWYLSSYSIGGTLTYDVEVEPIGTAFTGNNTAAIWLPGLQNSYVTLPVSLTGGAQYHWQVRTWNSNSPNPSAWSTPAVFTIDSSQGGAPIPVLSYPVGTTVYSNSPTLYWYLSSYATGTITYDGIVTDLTVNSTPITFSTDSSFHQVNGLIGGHSYSWTVRTHNGANQSTYAAVDTFLIDPGQIPDPVPVAFWPVDSATVYSLNPVLSWYLPSAITGTPSFIIQLSNISGNYSSSSFHRTYSGQPGYYFTIPDTLTAGTTYYWQVETVNGGDTSNFSIETSFVIDPGQAGNPTPVAYWPNGGATVYTATPTFSWYLNNLAAGTVTYTIEVKYASTPFDSTTAQPILQSGISGTSFTLSSPLAYGTAYQWRVKLNSSTAGNSNWSVPATFSTYAPISQLVVPQIGSPYGGVVITSNSTTLSWFLPTAPSLVQTYSLEVSQYPDMSNPVISQDNITGFKKVISSLKGGRYYWRVQSKTSNGKFSNSSKVEAFTIGTITDVKHESNAIPVSFAVSQNYPNPFNPSTLINYSLPKSSLVTIKIYNILGQEIKTLINSEHQPGYYSIQWNGDNNYGHSVASGIYIYRVTAGQYAKSMKMMLLK
ncbi:MAG: right-handed parallel beta-helix repeat-containing protein [Ignavibacteriaceae bacterium]